MFFVYIHQYASYAAKMFTVQYVITKLFHIILQLKHKTKDLEYVIDILPPSQNISKS
jgi:hypothetical protein